jgi:hypothetical protein
MPAHDVCAYLPVQAVVRAVEPMTVQLGFALMPTAMPVPTAWGRFDAAAVDTGPPVVAALSSRLVLKI